MTNSGVNICGGVISQSQLDKDMKKYGVWADAMAYVMPDEKYDEWVELKKQKKDKEAHLLFEQYARSQI